MNNSSDPKRLVEEHNQNCPWRALSVPGRFFNRFELDSMFVYINHPILKDKFIHVDIYDEERIFSRFADSVKTYKNCYKLPILSQSIVEVSD